MDPAIIERNHGLIGESGVEIVDGARRTTRAIRATQGRRLLVERNGTRATAGRLALNR
jgi:hypothetical protein